MIMSLIIAMSAITADEIRPDRFYVAGISQNMTLSEYNSLIANGGFKSEPIAPDRFRAVIDNQAIYVDFCEGRIIEATAEYESSDWLRSMLVLEGAGFKWGAPVVTHSQNDLSTGYLAISATSPKGFSYFAAPLVKAASFRGHDMAAFQIMFRSMTNPCG